MPEVFDWLHFGEEPVAPEIESPTVTFDSSGDAADHVSRLEHGARSTCFRQFKSGGESSRTGSDDDH